MVKKWDKLLLIIGIDALFFVSVWVITSLISRFNSSLYSSILLFNGAIQNIISFLLLLFEIGLLILIYAFFKYIVVDIVQSMFTKKRYTVKRFIRFFIITLVMLLSTGAVISLFVFLTSVYFERLIPTATDAPFKTIFQFIVSIAVAAGIAIYVYLTINIAQFLSLKETSVKKILRLSWIMPLRSWSLYWLNIQLVFCGALVVGIGGLALILLQLSYIRIFSLSIAILVAYVIVLFNRIKLYELYSK
ncbi:hypothetical protein GOV09_02750 [Candidatus Woesearchaeota archaeon]|nr:hypothetical protein [Candidatus Woesearchaeota archaeon]